MKRKIRISQCMIVKNEEKNIRRALSWAKDIVFEQIVVDTGSTDRTVEIAKEMGAKVYHFEWIDDFAAAKNYAIEQASGEWIAFLDADEYMNQEDARKVVRLLEQVAVPKKGEKIPLFVRCALINLDNEGNPFNIASQDRFFRNQRDLRYYGKIHEQLRLPQNSGINFVHAEDQLSIYHTGYSKEVYDETGKMQRNIRQLKEIVEQNPKSYDTWSYLGDSQKALEDFENAKISYQKALEGEGTGKISQQGLTRARIGLMVVLAETASQYDSSREIYRLAEDYGYPDTDNPDPWFLLGVWHYNRKEMEVAREKFLQTLDRLDTYRGIGEGVAQGSIMKIYTWLAQACLVLNSPKETVRYCVLALRMNRYQDRVLTAILQRLKQESGESDQAEGTWGFLQNLYDFQSPKDLLFLLKCAKLAGFHALENRVLQTMPEELKREFQKPSGQESEDREG